MKFLRAIVNFSDRLNEKTGEVVSWAALVLVLVTVWDVTLRYVFHAGSVAFQELEWHLYAINFLVAAGWTLLKGGHVRIDILYIRMGDKQKAIVDIIGTFLFCIPFCLLVIWAGRPFFTSSFSIREFSPDPGGLPARYVLKAMIPIGFALIALQAISEAIKSYFTLSGKEKNLP